LIEAGVKEETIEEADAAIKVQVDAAVKFATNAPWPDKKEVFTDVLTTPTEVRGRALSELYKP
jgi:TPP-dependent pyruvate/acetoin dehydrogenase alpha subunit